MKSFPPYRIQVVREIPITTRAEREKALSDAAYNMFDVPARKVTIDLLTDSGRRPPRRPRTAPTPDPTPTTGFGVCSTS
jgi:hypothetical protein